MSPTEYTIGDDRAFSSMFCVWILDWFGNRKLESSFKINLARQTKIYIKLKIHGIEKGSLLYRGGWGSGF